MVMVTWSTLYLDDGLHMIRQHQPVGREAQLDVRRLLRHKLEGLEGLGRICQRIARTRDAQHRHLRDGGRDRQRLLRGLLRRQPLAHHAWAGFVGAVVFAVAVIALDVACGRHGHMHACIVVVRLLAIAGMVLDLLPDFRRQIALPCAGTAARLARLRFGCRSPCAPRSFAAPRPGPYRLRQGLAAVRIPTLPVLALGRFAGGGRAARYFRWPRIPRAALWVPPFATAVPFWQVIGYFGLFH